MLYVLVAFLAVTVGLSLVGLVLARAAGRTTPVPPGLEPIDAPEDDATEDSPSSSMAGSLKLTT